MAGEIDQRTLGIAAAGHQGGQSPLAAPAQQGAGELGRVEIGGRLHGFIEPSYCKKDLFSGLGGAIWGRMH